MITIKKNKYFFTAYQKWFPTKTTFLDSFKIVAYKQVRKNIKKKGIFISFSTYTYQTNLFDNIEDIFKKFSPTIRNEIRKTEKQKVKYNPNTSIEIFLEIYNNFAEIKQLSLLTHEKMLEYKNHLYVTSAELDGQVLAVHSYLIDYDSKIVRLLHSATQRFSESIDRNMVGRANKYLHYKDIEFFKEKKMKIYDWGGFAKNTKDKSLIGINRFKKAFGGKEEEQNEIHSFLYYLIFNFFKK